MAFDFEQLTMEGYTAKKRKAKADVQYRKHQADMVELSERIATRAKKFRMLAHVVCGGGKSWLPFLLARQLPESIRLCWVVPRLSLQSQAVLERNNCGIQLRDAGNETDPCRGYRGCVTTHQSFQNNPELWRHEFERKKYVLVVDEPHHAKISRNGELRPLARAIQMCEPHLAGLVYMTGTLSTGDSRYIYGIKYEELEGGVEVPTTMGFDYHIRYTRADALDENAIVPIRFFHSDGPVKWASLRTGEEFEVKLSDATRKQESDAIWTALSTELATGLFDRGYTHWKKHGRSLLVLCDSVARARQYHKELLVRGEKSFLAVSENAGSLEGIQRFKKTENGCLVTCQMAYEGLDHRPLSHVICLTHIRSAPWIEQALARVWRADEGKSECFAFVPDDPRMNRVIQKIKAEQPDRKLTKDVGGGGEGPGERDSLPLGSRLSSQRESALDEAIQSAMYTEQQKEALKNLLALGIPRGSEAMMQVLKEIKAISEPLQTDDPTPKGREKALRNQITDICRSIDYQKQLKFGSTGKVVFRRYGKLEKLGLPRLLEVKDYVTNLCS